MAKGMDFNNKTIGIWGYGITGKAAVAYLRAQSVLLAVLDKKTLSPDDHLFLEENAIPFYEQSRCEEFLQTCDYILPSPGVDLRSYSQYQSKWLSELDVFYAAWHKPVIAITGSVGKTTITHLLSLLLERTGKKVATGGNIGIPMLDLLAQQKQSDIAVLEVSSFQLEHTRSFAPTLAIWSNFYPNHLDRHGSEQEYRDAKAKITVFQQSEHQILIPIELRAALSTRAQMHYFALEKPKAEFLATLPAQSKLYYCEGDALMRYENGVHINCIARSLLPAISYEENWLILFAALDLSGITMPIVQSQDLALPAHRLEYVATSHDVDFYNDSKSTTAQSTMAAVNRLYKRPILLLLGGMGKGVDRAPLIQELKGKVRKIYCFGKEADQLKALCDAHHIPSESHANLDSAFAACVHDGKKQDQIVLSPSGASFDLFANYMERGDYFKKLVASLK